LMGDKVAARAAAVACGVPVLPGSDAAVTEVTEALEIAEHVGWPVAVKASFGGGGRGLRIALSADGLKDAMEQATREAASAFGRPEVFIERYLPRPRHVEVQVLGDATGTLLHLGDRDCSVQRRHQKLLEEAPAPGLSARLRAQLAEAALSLCRAVGYHSAGTVEFLVDARTEEFYFLEMNTRLQVEHGVTELVTGIDIVQQQILVAAGEALRFRQEDVQIRGHAMQARIAAEDPWSGFRPAAGTIQELMLPTGPWLRLDFGFESGDCVPQYYDSMLGKVQAWGQSREEARVRLGHALDALHVDGPPTTASYLRSVLSRDGFVEVSHDTASLERDWAPDTMNAITARPGREPSRRTDAPSSRTERQVTVPWGGELVPVAVYGIADAGGGTAGVGGTLPAGSDRRTSVQGGAGDGVVRAPMDSVVVSCVSEVGARVSRGTPLLVLEAMKMEVVIHASVDGALTEYFVTPGDTVKSGAPLARVQALQPQDDQPPTNTEQSE
jgi:acetyl-CoA/propionyl-CoA carboxylase biotin carboxyl carrier protein